MTRSSGAGRKRDLARVKTVKIYPAIGVARLGNSTTSFFIGPERPGDRTPPAGGYKDARCRVRRQAARFRVYGFDAAGALVGEITAADAKIEWTVHLANRKADARQFDALNANAPLRNSAAIPNVAPVSDRAQLVIDPGARTLTAPHQSALFDTGMFLGSPVALGEMRTDRNSRLLVLGGFGTSASPTGLPLTTFANNDRWYDDVSDGPVTAKVRIGPSRLMTASPSWVICAPPDFAPAVESVTSLYDALFQIFVDKGWIAEPNPPSLTRDVWPILRRALDIERTSMMASGKHQAAIAAAFPGVGAANQAGRDAVLAKVNNPTNPDVDDADMPMLWSDVYTPGKGETMTRVQYNVLTHWQVGNAVDDWTGAEPAPPSAITPDGLTRAALEACVGGPFYPGIEASWFLRDTYSYLEPFRLDASKLQAGDVTKQMAVPWQADFTDCTQDGELAWWPAQRPDDVYPVGMTMQMPWTRDIVSTPADMVRDWSRLGFVVEEDGALVETERTKICPRLRIVLIRPELTISEIEALAPAGTPVLIRRAFLVVADAFMPDMADTKALKIKVSAGGRSLGGVTAEVTAVHLENRDETMTTQRITFECALLVDPRAFNWRGTRDVLAARIEVSIGKGEAARSDEALLQLARARAPLFTDGHDGWASEDLRVVQVRPGESVNGITLGRAADAPTTFLVDLLDSLNSDPAATDCFQSLAAGRAAPEAEFVARPGGRPVYNFAIARVRGMAAHNRPTSVLFRAFCSLSLGTDHGPDTFHRSRSRTAPAPLLGLRGGELVSVPCFAAPRVDVMSDDMRTQPDPANRVRERSPMDDRYFGCWLDVNQTSLQFPRHPETPHGPFERARRPIQQLLRGGDSSIVAELYSVTEPLHPGTSPLATTRLAMRSAATRLVVPGSNAALASAVVPFSIRATSPSAADGISDELVIDWHALPAGADVTLYLPRMRADVLLTKARRYYSAARFERVDHHTLRLLPADISYLPIPEAHEADQPALLTVRLPKGVTADTSYTLTIDQLSVERAELIGTIGITLTVAARRGLRAIVADRLAVLRHISAAIATDDPWRGVTDRQVAHLAEQLRGLGADPDTISASPDGATSERG